MYTCYSYIIFCRVIEQRLTFLGAGNRTHSRLTIVSVGQLLTHFLAKCVT
jgi:hypothetical protein